MNFKQLERVYLEVMEAQALRKGDFRCFMLHERIQYEIFYMMKINNMGFREHIGIDMTRPATVIIYWWR